MTIYLKKKQSLQLDVFNFRCSIGKNGLSKSKIEGDLKTPIGVFSLEDVYYRSDRVDKPITNLIKNHLLENYYVSYQQTGRTRFFRRTRYQLLRPLSN